MAYEGLQEYLGVLDERGLLARVRREVDPEWEIAAVCRVNFRNFSSRERRALLFERIRGHTVPLAAGVLGGSERIYAAALGTTVERAVDVWAAGTANPVDPVEVASAPCQEVVLTGDEVDVTRLLPNPIWTVGQDPGPYLTSPCVLSRDPESGIRNLGTYRLQVKGPRRLGMLALPRKGLTVHIQKNEARGRATPVSIAVGTDPVLGLVSTSSFPRDADEIRIAGGIRGEPVPLARAVSQDVPVPATAEIVIEGSVPAGVREPEGPFGEYTGYMSPTGDSFVVEVSAVTMRRRPVAQAFVSQMPPSESSCIRSLTRGATLLRHLRQTLGLPVRDLVLSEASGANAFIRVSLRKTDPAQVQQVFMGLWSMVPLSGKVVVVVDDDIDVRDPAAVEWAIAWRVQPDRDVHVFHDLPAIGLDPSTSGESRHGGGGLTSRLGIDATRKHDYPPAAAPPREHVERVQADWAEYGITAAEAR